MMDDAKTEALNRVVSALLGRDPRPPTILSPYVPIIDVSRPNLHESKKDFLLELSSVEAVIANLRSILDHTLPPEAEDGRAKKEMQDRLHLAIEVKAAQRARNRELRSPSDLAIKNIFDTGFLHGSLRVVAEMYMIFHERLSELKDQEAQFWTLTNRPPNYYARTIALRLARLYASEKGHRPTFGMARDGNFPSTEFGRTLEEVFRILEIRASVRNAATWAIAQLTEDDLRPFKNALSGLYGYSGNALGSIVNALAGR